MDRLIETLRRQLEISERGRILPCARGGSAPVAGGSAPAAGGSAPVAGGRAAVTDRDFIEAYPYATHSHTYFEGMWMLRGSAHMKIDGEIHALEANDFCLLAPQSRHADIYDRNTPAYESLWFAYQPEMVNAHIFHYEPVGEWHCLSYNYASSGPAIAGILLALQAELADGSRYSEQAARGLLVQLTVWLLRAMESAAAGDLLQVVPGKASGRALAYMRAHYAENVTLGDVARAACLSPHYLASVFKQETGQTVMDALTEIRLAHARRLLLEGGQSVGEVATAVGYGSLHHFSRLFRRAAGVPPSQYGRRGV